MKRRIVIMALVVASLCSMCLFPGPVGAADTAEPTEYVLSSCADQLKMIGRNAVDESGVYVAWSNAGFAFTGEFQGEVKLTVEGHTSYYAYHNIVVVVDGEYDLAHRMPIYNGERTYVIADVEPGVHTIEIYKMNEARWGYLLFKTLQLDGTLQPRPEKKELQIEFIGDSITCGYGIYPSGGKKEYPVIGGKTLEEEDSFFNYAGVITRALDADASYISLGGWGIVQGGALPEENVPRIYDQICGVGEGPLLDAWNFADNQVDVVISNQGTNDWLLWSQGGEEQIKEGAANFCRTLREKYPEAEIIWCYGMMHTVLDEALRQAVESVGDPKLHYVTLPTNTAGGAEHPDYWGHDAAAQVLLNYMREHDIV